MDRGGGSGGAGGTPPTDGNKPFRPSRGPVFGTGGRDVGGGFGSAAEKQAGRAPSGNTGTGSQDAYRFRGKQYVRSQDGWFESRGSQLVQVAPPVGLAVDALPANHETRWIDGVPYFVSGDAYFVWRERERKYEIVEPPAGALAAGAVDAPAVLPSGERPLGP